MIASLVFFQAFLAVPTTISAVATLSAIGISYTIARVVDLKFLSFPWHPRSGTSNP
jgi:hypothetical protein